MNKTLKIVGLSVAVLVGLLLVTVLVVSFAFDPNQYKDEIIQLVKEKTGRDLKIGKKIGWSFFPRLGIEAGGLELSNAAGFGKEPFAKIDAAGVRVEFAPLLRGRIAVERIYLHGLSVNLAKNAAGQNNWQDMTARNTETPATAEKGSSSLPIKDLSIGKLEIRRANLNWRDDTAGSLLAVRNLEVTTGKFTSGQAFDMTVGFELARDQSAPVKVALQSRVTAAPDALNLSKLDLKVDESRLTGTLDVQNFASPALRFDLALDKIDLDRYLAPGKTTAKAPDTTKPAATTPTELPLSTLRSLDMKGTFRIKDFKAFNLRSNDAQIQLNAKNGVIAFGPNQAKLYGGSYRGETVMDVRGKTAQFKFNEKLESVQIGPLLKDMQLFDNYTGTGNIALKLTGQGFNAAQIKKSLNGTASLAFRDGKIEGVDLLKLIEQARALDAIRRGKPVDMKASQSDATVFKSLTGNVTVTNGIARNEDLVLDGANLRATGRGSADLASEVLDYRLKVTLAEDAKRSGTTVPVLVTGNFANPKFKVDAGEMLKQEAGKQIEKQLQKGLEDLLKGKKRK